MPRKLASKKDGPVKAEVETETEAKAVAKPTESKGGKQFCISIYM